MQTKTVPEIVKKREYAFLEHCANNCKQSIKLLTQLNPPSDKNLTDMEWLLLCLLACNGEALNFVDEGTMASACEDIAS